VDIDITSHCNLRCQYCYHFDDPAKEYSDLPTQQWLQFFDELGACGVMQVTLAGGEPFLRRDLRTLLQGITANRMRFSILSNGSLITDELADFIASTGRCDSIQVSVDGSCAEVHDAARGKGSFDGAMKGIMTLQRHHVLVDVRVTVHRHNVADLPQIAKLLLEELSLQAFSTNAAGYLGSCQLNAAGLMLRPEDRSAAMATLLNLSKQYPGRITANAGPLAEARRFSAMEAARQRRERITAGGGTLSGCGCSFSKIAVRSDGVIVPCNLMPSIELGRINQDSLTTVWQDDERLAALRSRSSISLEDFAFCRDCPYIDNCTGNCPALSLTLVSRIDHPSPDACLRKFLVEGGCLPMHYGTPLVVEETDAGMHDG